MLRSLETAAVVINETIPSVSKKAVTKPIAVCSGVGTARPPRKTVTEYSASITPRPTNSRVLTSMNEFIGIGFRHVDGRVVHLLHRCGEQGPHDLGPLRRHLAVRRQHRHRRLQRV